MRITKSVIREPQHEVICGVTGANPVGRKRSFDLKAEFRQNTKGARVLCVYYCLNAVDRRMRKGPLNYKRGSARSDVSVPVKRCLIKAELGKMIGFVPKIERGLPNKRSIEII